MRTRGGPEAESQAMNRGDCVLIFANPRSGPVGNRRRVRAVERALERRGLSVLTSWDPHEWPDVLTRTPSRGRFRAVVAAGGDGTVSQVINCHPTTPLAVFPLGTENLFARCFGFPSRPEPLAERIMRGTPTPIDLGRIGDRRFSLLVTAGLDADVVRRLHRWRTAGRGLKRISYLNYVRPIIDAVKRYPFPIIELEADGRRVLGAQVFVFNLPAYALELPIAPDVDWNDGLLDWVALEKPGLRNLLGYLGDIAQGRHLERPDVHSGKARLVRIRSERPAPIEVDGDPAGFTPVEVRVEANSLKVLLGPPGAPRAAPDVR